jgi:hypothetical protein
MHYFPKTSFFHTGSLPACWVRSNIGTDTVTPPVVLLLSVLLFPERGVGLSCAIRHQKQSVEQRAERCRAIGCLAALQSELAYAANAVQRTTRYVMKR